MRSLDELSRLLSEHETAFSLALEVGEVGVWIWDLEDSSLRWDSTMHRLFGSTPSSFRKDIESFEELVHADDLARVKNAIEAILAAPDQHYNVTFRVKNVPNRRIRARGKVITDSEGKPVRMVGVCVEDFSDRPRCFADCPYTRFDSSGNSIPPTVMCGA